MSLENYEGRISLKLEDQPTLLLANTTLSDSGTYRCIIKTYYLSINFDINVTIAGRTGDQKVKGFVERDPQNSKIYIGNTS